MNIINADLSFRDGLSYGNNPKMVILHHADAVICSIEDIHRWHLQNGWSGCGYHYFVRKDGTVYIGRDEKAIGAHCLNYNAVSIGICVDGNFNVEAMVESQYSSLLQLTKSILNKYGISKIYGHFELYSTDCPGSNFPLDRIKKEAVEGENCASYPGYLIKMNSGLEDDNVKIIQNKLIEQGYDVGRCGADGYFGEDTLKAIKKFQLDIGICDDGVVGPSTWNNIIK
ncbi:peptidoglycan-binding domain-containing protein [Clostridiaceae bacterium UIB06]|uniref:Peptidoglycan-binding domain-containing protein n=1 Tax=Clostridium thailandense TaxID=2794346 RepID=A0A949TUH7_9CLOT|nr:peptidoglycan-binding domain-containing protein [Clostridium thailandense]MBV7271630.1 peptidoglycan-binding domain-containing protein [Clostridium thailandense]MCH5136400.1 peptidoglycan-binding domain-containing protein [Clostridiaceae bacterium UIB06]